MAKSYSFSNRKPYISDGPHLSALSLAAPPGPPCPPWQVKLGCALHRWVRMFLRRRGWALRRASGSGLCWATPEQAKSGVVRVAYGSASQVKRHASLHLCFSCKNMQRPKTPHTDRCIAEGRPLDQQAEEDLERECAWETARQAEESGAWFARNRDRLMDGR